MSILHLRICFVLTHTQEQYHCCNSRQNDWVLPRKKIFVQDMITVHERLEKDKTPHMFFLWHIFTILHSLFCVIMQRHEAMNLKLLVFQMIYIHHWGPCWLLLKTVRCGQITSWHTVHMFFKEVVLHLTVAFHISFNKIKINSIQFYLSSAISQQSCSVYKRFHMAVAQFAQASIQSWSTIVILSTTRHLKKSNTPRPYQPQPDALYDNIGHLPLHSDKLGQCNFCPKGVPRWKCQKPNVCLC